MAKGKSSTSFKEKSGCLHVSCCQFMRIFEQAERQRKEDADAHRKAEDDAKKKIALSSMGSGYSGILQRVLFCCFFYPFKLFPILLMFARTSFTCCVFVTTQTCN